MRKIFWLHTIQRRVPKKNMNDLNIFLNSIGKIKNCKFFFSSPNADENSKDVIRKLNFL